MEVLARRRVRVRSCKRHRSVQSIGHSSLGAGIRVGAAGAAERERCFSESLRARITDEKVAVAKFAGTPVVFKWRAVSSPEECVAVW